jgi:transcription elongation factor Elf1
MLRRWRVECPRCSEVWLVVGARENDAYVCKGCGHRFTIRFPAAPRDDPPVSAAAADESR